MKGINHILIVIGKTLTFLSVLINVKNVLCENSTIFNR